MDWNNRIIRDTRNENFVNDLKKVPDWAKAENLEMVMAQSEIWKLDKHSSYDCKALWEKRIKMEIALEEKSVSKAGDKVRAGFAGCLYRLADLIAPALAE